MKDRTNKFVLKWEVLLRLHLLCVLFCYASSMLLTVSYAKVYSPETNWLAIIEWCYIYSYLANCNNTGLQLATISSNYSTNVQDRCLLMVQLTCTVQNLTSLRWFFDGGQVYSYTYADGSTFPHVLHEDSGLSISIISAASHSAISDHFNGTSVLTTDTSVLSMRMIDSIQCGTNTIRSQTITREMLERNGKAQKLP